MPHFIGVNSEQGTGAGTQEHRLPPPPPAQVPGGSSFPVPVPKTHFSRHGARLHLLAAWEERSSQRRLSPHPDPLLSAWAPRGSRWELLAFSATLAPSLSPAWLSSASALLLVNTSIKLPLPPQLWPHGFARRPLGSLPIWQVAAAFSPGGGRPSSTRVCGESWARSSRRSGETIPSTPDKTDAEVRSEPGEEPAGRGQIT